MLRPLRPLRPLCLVLLGLSLGLGAACSKDDPSPSRKPAAATVSADGVRTIQIEAGREGYVPDTIAGKPGEKLRLVFTRTVDGECLAELKTPEGKVVTLPKNSPVPIEVTVPTTGGLTFACGMDMFRGQIVSDAKS